MSSTKIFEFKYSETDENLSKTAMAQIIEKKYVDAEQHKSNRVIAVGVSFSGQTKSINGVEQKEFPCLLLKSIGR